MPPDELAAKKNEMSNQQKSDGRKKMMNFVWLKFARKPRSIEQRNINQLTLNDTIYKLRP